MQRYAIDVPRRLGAFLDPLAPPARLRGPAGHLWEQFCLPAAVGRRLLWSPNNTGPLAVSRQVCTMHDLIPLDRPEWFSPRFSAWYRFLLPRLARRAAHCIAISEYTRQRLLALSGIDERRVTVIPNGIDPSFRPAAPEAVAQARAALHIPEGPYLLSVGSLEPRKNLPLLLRAWRTAQTSVDPSLTLVVAGAQGGSRVFAGSALGPVPPRVHFTGYVPDAHLAALYTGAAAFLYPSLYEGFGLPPLEAMACGTPVITSDTTSLPEVAADAAVLVDPASEADVANAIVDLLTSPPRLQSFSAAGLRRAARFSWDDAAAQTRAVLERAA
jgi:glycosyltransferase involved in cell wall biosynthesis